MAKDRPEVELWFRSYFGEPCESTWVSEREERRKELAEMQKDVGQCLGSTRAEQRRLQRELEQSRSGLVRRAATTVARGNEAIGLAASVEAELRQVLNL